MPKVAISQKKLHQMQLILYEASFHSFFLFRAVSIDPRKPIKESDDDNI